MRVIKRYPNRKLYDTEMKQYIQLKGITELIRHGVEIQVVDHASGEDLTTIVLTQVIMGVEKEKTSSTPSSMLSGLIRASEDRITELQRNLFGQLGFWRFVDEEIQRRIQKLVDTGELTDGEAEILLNKLVDQSIKHPVIQSTPTNEVIERVLEKRNVPSRAMVEDVMAQLDSLMAKLNETADKK